MPDTGDVMPEGIPGVETTSAPLSPVPSQAEQAEQITRLQEAEERHAGDTCYLVACRWYQAFRQYVGIRRQGDILSLAMAGQERKHPGPIDNSSLLEASGQDAKVKVLVKFRMESTHYYVVSAAAWELLVAWYGTIQGQPPLPRKLVGAPGSLTVEAYLLDLRLATPEKAQRGEWIVRGFSKEATIREIKAVMAAELELPDDDTTRVWNFYLGQYYKLLDELEQPLRCCAIYSFQQLLIEQKGEDGTWPSDKQGRGGSAMPNSARESTYVASTYTNRYTTGYNSTNNRAGYAAASSGDQSKQYGGSAYGYASVTGGKSSTPSLHEQSGQTGLRNLGNTCFMAAALQCLSHTPELSRYFRDGSFRKDLNRTNPIGCNGKLAEAFAELLEDLWSGRHHAVSPTLLKKVVSKHAPRFSGYAQHDSHELLAFLLDGLHEDLNRIKDKPYLESKDADGRPDAVVAAEAWQRHKMRNDSKIVDLFQGQFKSTLVCPDCQKVSITFDPYMYLSVPLPDKEMRTVKVIVLWADPTKLPRQYGVQVRKNKGTIHELIEGLASQCGSNAEQLRIGDVPRSTLRKLFTDTDSVREIYAQDMIYAFELPPPSEEPDANEVAVVVYHRTESVYRSSYHHSYSQRSSSRVSHTPFGVPMMVRVPADMTEDALKSVIGAKLLRCSKKDALPRIAVDSDAELEAAFAENAGDAAAAAPPMGADGDVDMTGFSLHLCDSYGADTATVIGDKPLRNGQFLGLTWPSDIKARAYDRDADLLHSRDPSVSASVAAAAACVSLDDCMKQFTKAEKLSQTDMWRCPHCKEEKQAEKKMEVWSVPQMLVIQLKRFSYNSYSRSKLTTMVDFPLEGLDMTKYVLQPDGKRAVYDLIAVSNHMGGYGCGHYTAYCREGSEWYDFDDSRVSPASRASVASTSSYVLFYERVDEPAAGETSTPMQNDDVASRVHYV